jgi:hypothetical protein
MRLGLCIIPSLFFLVAQILSAEHPCADPTGRGGTDIWDGSGTYRVYCNSGPTCGDGINIWDGSKTLIYPKLVPSVIYVPNYTSVMISTTSVPREGCTTAFSFDFFSLFADCVYCNSGPTCGGGFNIWDGSKSLTALKFVPSVTYVPNYTLLMISTTSVPREGSTTALSFDFFPLIADCVYCNSGTTRGGGFNIWDGSKSLTTLEFVPSVIYVPNYTLLLISSTSVPREGCTTALSFDLSPLFADCVHCNSGPTCGGGFNIWYGSKYPTALKLVPSVIYVPIYTLVLIVTTSVPMEECNMTFSFDHFSVFADCVHYDSGLTCGGSINIWDGSKPPTALQFIPSVIYVPIYTLVLIVTTSVPMEERTTTFSFDYFSVFADCVYCNSGLTCGGGINIWDGSKSPTALQFIPSVIYVPIYTLVLIVTTFVPMDERTTTSSFDFFSVFAGCVCCDSFLTYGGGINIWDGSEFLTATKFVLLIIYVSTYNLVMIITTSVPREECTMTVSVDFFSVSTDCVYSTSGTTCGGGFNIWGGSGSIVHLLFSFIIEISTSTRKDFSENHVALA